ncbi:formin-like protein 20 isoform X2 [Drosophila rhopaloa]|nr:formin-like protein 20 isoform X2 [Drosophila rhopaloa]
MQVSTDVFAHPPPAVRPPPSYADNVSTNASIDGMKSSSSSNSLDRYAGAPPSLALAGPSFATSVLVSNKGSKYEISGPVNFQHVSGDVLRDRTRNAFDLNADSKDKVLKKYMMERGITEEDISGMRRQDVIKKIVHSNFTWMPSKSDMHAKPQAQEPDRPLLYATISTNNTITPPPSPPPPSMVTASKPAVAPNFSNYASLTSRFVDISDLDLPGPAPAAPTHSNVRQQEVGSVIPVQVQPQANRPKVPPPPSAVMARNTHGYPAAIDISQVRPSAQPKVSNETYATIAPQRKAGTMRIPPPAPPKPTIVPNTNSTSSMGSLYAVSTVQHAPVVKPPPPAPPAKPTSRVPSDYASPPTVQNTKINSGQAPVPPPPPPVASAGVPPPPPPMPVAVAGGAPPPPPPPPAGMAGVPPPPPMQKSPPQAAPAASSGGDPSDAFLASIRQGVTLKKVDQKAATISGIKPRPERKPATTDFLSELKLGITLRRVKNPADNPYSEESESQA